MLSKSVDDIRHSGVADNLEDRISLQNDLDQLDKWIEINQMKLSKNKCKVLQSGINNTNAIIQNGEQLAKLQYCRKGFGGGGRRSNSALCTEYEPTE